MGELIASILVIGSLLPLLISIVNQPQWSSRTRTIMSVGVSILAGVVAYVSENGLDFSTPSNIVATIVGTVLATSVAYRNIWKPTGVAHAIEFGTSPTHSTASAEAYEAHEVAPYEEAPADA